MSTLSTGGQKEKNIFGKGKRKRLLIYIQKKQKNKNTPRIKVIGTGLI